MRKQYLTSNISTAGSYPLTNKSTLIFFNCERITISLFKYHCSLREDGAIVSTYVEFSDELLEEIFDIIGNEQQYFHLGLYSLFVLRNIKRYKVFIRENFIILIKRKKKLSNTLHIAPDGQSIF